MDVEQAILKQCSVLPGTLYFPDFISEDEESYLIRKIQESSQHKWKILPNRRLQIWGGEITPKGTLCGQPLPKFITKYPDLVSRLKEKGIFTSAPHREPNHVIMNEYHPGQGIMPHEDGPVYHPVVATLSLGSHTVFHYYRYKEREGSSDSAGTGRAIDLTPAHSLLLERRSLVVSFDDMYTSHLHGIDGKTEDLVTSPDLDDMNHTSMPHPPGSVRIENFHLLSKSLQHAIREGNPLRRETRWSLTCRDVPRTVSLATRRTG